MTQVEELIEKIGLTNTIYLDDIPFIDLYMDQVTQLFESKYGSGKRNPDDKILTKTMINNYAKGKLLFPIKNKKYSREHIMLINLIYQLKGALSINDIKKVLTELNNNVVNDDINLENIYRKHLDVEENNKAYFEKEVKQLTQHVNEQVTDKNANNAYINQLLLVTALVNRSSMYRKLAEVIVDGMENDNKKGNA